MRATTPLQALDACHRQIHIHLQALADLAQRLSQEADYPLVRQRAKDIEAFFSATAREHHAEEERSVFPRLLQSADEALTLTIERLRQDHGWIEQNWLELGPMLRAVAQGEDWVDPAELQHALDVFTPLLANHIALEESIIYPQAVALAAADEASRIRRAQG